MAAMPVVHCFVAPEDYQDLRLVSADGAGMAESFEAYAVEVEKFLEYQRAQGSIAVKMYIKPADLVAWCRREGRAIDSRARAAYAVRLYADSVRNNPNHEKDS